MGSGWRPQGWRYIYIYIWMRVNDLLLTIWLSKCRPRPSLCLQEKGLYCTSFNTDMGLFKEQKKLIKYKTIYIRNIKMKNRNIHSKVISVKLFCREKVLRMYCTFILICWFFANKILCLRPDHFSDVLFSFVLSLCKTSVKVSATTDGVKNANSIPYLTTWWYCTHIYCTYRQRYSGWMAPNTGKLTK